MKKRILIDCETTGLNPDIHALAQIAGAVEIDGKREQEFNLRMRPYEGASLTMEALKITGRTIEELFSAQSSKEAYCKFVSMLERFIDPYNKNDKFVWVGYNARFDMDFTRAWLRQNDNNYFGSYFQSVPACVMHLAALIDWPNPGPPNFKLTTIAEHLGIPFNIEEAHDAMWDINLTDQAERQMRRCMGPMVPWEQGRDAL